MPVAAARALIPSTWRTGVLNWRLWVQTLVLNRSAALRCPARWVRSRRRWTSGSIERARRDEDDEPTVRAAAGPKDGPAPRRRTHAFALQRIVGLEEWRSYFSRRALPSRIQKLFLKPLSLLFSFSPLPSFCELACGSSDSRLRSY